MHILITGGAGYIGSHCAKAVAEAGHLPVVYDSLEKGHRWAVQWGPLVEADLADTASLGRALSEHKIEAVIHFAGYIEVGESMRAPGRFFQNNYVNTVHLLEAMRRAGLRHIVFSSTAAVYGDPEAVPIPESHPTRPVSPYGESKLMVERTLAWYERIHGFAAARLRYFNAAGADSSGAIGEAHDPESHLVPRTIFAAQGKLPALKLFGTDYDTPDGTAIRDYVHVTDLAAAHLLALGRIRAHGSGFACNLGTGNGYSVREVISTVERVTGLKVPAAEELRRPGDSPRLVADSTAARSELGWTPRHSSLDEIVSTAYAWHASR
jgi:UDP-arabinose 4-epimerase